MSCACPSLVHCARRPYTIDNDPEYGFVDAELNEKGRGQATALQQATASLAAVAAVPDDAVSFGASPCLHRLSRDQAAFRW